MLNGERLRSKSRNECRGYVGVSAAGVPVIGIGRMVDGALHYITTRHKETMYDFADALREYGVVDAIYITGGNAYDFHRTHLFRKIRHHALDLL